MLPSCIVKMLLVLLGSNLGAEGMGSEASQRQEVEPRALLSFSEPSEEGRGQERGPKPAASQPFSRAAQGWLFLGCKSQKPPESLARVCVPQAMATQEPFEKIFSGKQNELDQHQDPVVTQPGLSPKSVVTVTTRNLHCGAAAWLWVHTLSPSRAVLSRGSTTQTRGYLCHLFLLWTTHPHLSASFILISVSKAVSGLSQPGRARQS